MKPLFAMAAFGVMGGIGVPGGGAALIAMKLLPLSDRLSPKMTRPP
jgi:hypothetical protein